MKKFNSGDIIYNTIKAYPKVRFFANSGVVNSDSIFDFLPEPPPGPIPPEECFLLAEDGQTLLSEDNQELQPEYCDTAVPAECVILAENGNLLIGQNGNFLTKEQCEELTFLLSENTEIVLNEAGTGLTTE
jgi:hypothetical protein